MYNYLKVTNFGITGVTKRNSNLFNCLTVSLHKNNGVENGNVYRLR